MDSRQPFKKLCSNVLSGSNTTTAPALTLRVHNAPAMIPVRPRYIANSSFNSSEPCSRPTRASGINPRALDAPTASSGPSWLAPRAKGVRASLDVAAADIAATLHRHQTHVHRGHLGVPTALGLREQLLQRMRQQLIRHGILAPAHELAGGNLVEDGRQLMVGTHGTQDVVLEQLHDALEASSVAAHERDLVHTTLRDGVRDFDGRVGIFNRAPRVGRQSREGCSARSLHGASDLCVEITARITAVQRGEPRRTVREA